MLFGNWFLRLAATAGIGWTFVMIIIPQRYTMLNALTMSLLSMIPIIVASWLLGHQPNNFN